MPSNKNFGTTFGIIFLIVSVYIYIKFEQLNIYVLIISILFFLGAITNSKALNPLNKFWYKFGIFLGNIISPLTMGVVYFGVVTPTGLIMKILDKNLLNLKKNDKKTYWIDRNKKKINFKKQF
tara:strand:- start:539 stop:907 length:369 start_codon:yes stop_codon:yes gene_type:complete